MKICNFTYHDRSLGWRLSPVEFKNFTLLIGASGVGKTRILESLLALKAIANGASYKGVEWDVRFESQCGLSYRWEGAFENKGIDMQLYRSTDKENMPTGEQPAILFENVFLNGKQIIKRTQDQILFNGKKTPRLSQQQSIINLLKEEESIGHAYRGFKKVIINHYSLSQGLGIPFDLFDLQKLAVKYADLERIRNSDEDIKTKLYLVYRNVPEVFARIRDQFTDFFPQVEELKIEALDANGDLPPFVKEKPFIQIREKGVDKWIYQFRVSAGMYRTLLHLCELVLASAGTVILIDEFENSLGVNCIDALTAELLSAGRDIQFIITSHHPYIINNIDFKHWKLVTRNAGLVKTVEPETLNLGKSKHDAFIQLLNLDLFRNGIGLDTE